MSHFDALKNIEISTESTWAIVIIFPHSDFQFGIYWKLTIYKEIDDFLCLHHFFDCSINDLASMFFSSIHQWNGQWILPQIRRNVCIFTFKPHTPNEMRKKKQNEKKTSKERQNKSDEQRKKSIKTAIFVVRRRMTMYQATNISKIIHSHMIFVWRFWIWCWCSLLTAYHTLVRTYMWAAWNQMKTDSQRTHYVSSFIVLNESTKNLSIYVHLYRQYDIHSHEKCNNNIRSSSDSSKTIEHYSATVQT